MRVWILMAKDEGSVSDASDSHDEHAKAKDTKPRHRDGNERASSLFKLRDDEM